MQAIHLAFACLIDAHRCADNWVRCRRRRGRLCVIEHADPTHTLPWKGRVAGRVPGCLVITPGPFCWQCDNLGCTATSAMWGMTLSFSCIWVSIVRRESCNVHGWRTCHFFAFA